MRRIARNFVLAVGHAYIAASFTLFALAINGTPGVLWMLAWGLCGILLHVRLKEERAIWFLMFLLGPMAWAFQWLDGYLARRERMRRRLASISR